MKFHIWAAGCCAAAMLVAGASDVLAADMDAMPADPLMHGDLTVYGWVPTVTGKIGVNGRGPYDIPEGGDSSIIDLLDGFFMANSSLRYGDWGVFGDFVWADLGSESTTAKGFAAAETGLSGVIATGALTYALADSPEGHLDALLGARFWSVEGTVKLSLLGGAWSSQAVKTINWVDPVVGLRGHYMLSDSLFVSGTGAIGGFGAGSDFMWDAAATISYNFTDNFSASLGYRGMGADYSRNGDVVDITAHGPVAGLTFKF